MRFDRMKVLVLASAAGLAGCASLQASDTGRSGAGLQGFASESQLDAFARKLAKRAAEQRRNQPLPMSVAVEAAADSEAPAQTESITNTQEAGVDEGGIVKNAGDYLVVLRRGRIFTIRHGDNDLQPVDAINAFPPGKRNPGDTWYDEMLVRGDQIIIIGYSYGSFGTEVSRFRISKTGELSYRDTHYLRSGDYYSSSNYASRLIGDELVFYTPVPMRWENWRESLPALRGFGEDGEVEELVSPKDFLIADPYRGGAYDLEVAHTITRCDVSTPDFKCSSKAIAGTWSHAFYVSREAVYVWTGYAERASGEGKTPGQLYRIPLDGGRPGAVGVVGAPIDQFSFAEDARDGVLRVLLRNNGFGEGMWASEVTSGDVALGTVPIRAFGNGSQRLDLTSYRDLPEPAGYRLHNRFVGPYLLYAAGDYRGESRTPTVYAVPLDGRAVQEIRMPHGVTRFDVLGSDGVVVGPDGKGALGFSALALGPTASIEDTYLLPSASEGETRSQAFFYRPDRDARDGASGTLGLPVSRRLTRPGAEFLGSGSSIFFLRRDNRNFTPAGELIAETESAVDDNCIASCVDWYGNARPIFMGDRVFALMGYELVEGVMGPNRITEVRRVSFAPTPSRR